MELMFNVRSTLHSPTSSICPGLPVDDFNLRQQAPSFNQPLSFNTSSVKVMNYMFAVRTEHLDLSTCPPVCVSWPV